MPDQVTLRALTPPQLAERWAVSPEKIIALILAGQLEAFDVATPGSTRRRWRIAPEAVQTYERTHAAKPKPAPRARRRRPAEPRETYF